MIPNIRYGKLLTRLTGPIKTLKNAHNTGFLRLARAGRAGWRCRPWRTKCGSGRPWLSVCLFGTARRL